MANIEGGMPKVSLIKEYIKSSGGTIFDRRNSGGREILVARGGVSNGRPTFKMPEGTANRMPPEGIE